MNEEAYLRKLSDLEYMLQKNKASSKKRVKQLQNELFRHRRVAHKIHLLREQKSQQDALYQKNMNKLLEELSEVDTNHLSNEPMCEAPYGVGLMSPAAYKAYDSVKACVNTSYSSDATCGESYPSPKSYSQYSDEVLCSSPYNDKCEDYPVCEDSVCEETHGDDCAPVNNSADLYN
jgi:hypothetical protein